MEQGGICMGESISQILEIVRVDICDNYCKAEVSKCKKYHNRTEVNDKRHGYVIEEIQQHGR